MVVTRTKTVYEAIVGDGHMISGAIDAWSSLAKHGYLGMAIRWITEEFELVQIGIGVFPFKGSHGATETSECTIASADMLGLEPADFYSFTTDNEAAEVAAFTKQDQWAMVSHIRCSPHTLTLPVKKALVTTSLSFSVSLDSGLVRLVSQSTMSP